jgi:HD-like signal output (HDOD) protein
MKGFWRHSLCVGVTAKLMARKRNIDSKIVEEYFTAGLLHDIGKIPLSAAIPQEYMDSVNNAGLLQLPLFRVEETQLGVDHSAIGGLIVNAWRLVGAVGDAINYHHNYRDYPGPHQDILYSIVAANYFASSRVIGFSGDIRPTEPDPLIWNRLKAKPDILDDIEPLVNGEIDKAQVFLKI